MRFLSLRKKYQIERRHNQLISLEVWAMHHPKVLETKIVPINSVIIDQGIYPRSCDNKDRIDMFKEMFEEGHAVDAIRVARQEDGTLSLVDGNHRYKGAQKAGAAEISVDILDIDAADTKEMIKWAGVYNCFHGMPLTYGEKKILVCRNTTVRLK